MKCYTNSINWKSVGITLACINSFLKLFFFYGHFGELYRGHPQNLNSIYLLKAENKIL